MNLDHYEEILINSVYDARAALVRRLLSKTRDPAERRTYRNILNIRYPAERREALRRLGE